MIGSSGPAGPAGPQGPMPGLAMKFNTATNNADHDAGDVWLDAAAGSEVLLGIDDVDVDSNNIVARISVWDDSTTTALYGTVTIYQATDSANWIEMKITAVLSDQSGWTNFTVVHISKGGTIADNDLVYIDFNRSGDKGATGGSITGLDYNFETSTGDSDQGTGKVWLNNATRSSASILYIDDNDNQTSDLSAFIATWDDSDNTADRGFIKIQQRADNGIWSIFKVSGASVDATAYWKIAVTHIASSGSLADGNPLDVYFTRSGDNGSGLDNIVDDGSPQLGGDLDCNGSQIQWSKGSDVASATALPLLTDGNYFDVTGTATVTSFNATGGPGTQIKLHFDAACTLTHNSDLILPGGANIVTAAGDEADFIEFSAGDYRCTSYSKASGLPVVVAAYDADTLKADTADVLTAGFACTVHDAGTKASGTYTPDEADGNMQKAVNGGAHTLAVPANDCTMVIQYTNNASAGTITTSAYTIVDGDTITTTNGHDFFFYITNSDAFTLLTVKALQ